MRTSYKARQQRQYYERNDKANLQLFVCAHDIGQAGLQLGYRRVLGYLDRTPMSHLMRVSFCIDPLSGIWIPPQSGV